MALWLVENDPQMNGDIDEDQDTQGNDSKFKHMLKFSAHASSGRFFAHVHLQIYSKNEGQSHYDWLTINTCEFWIVFKFLWLNFMSYSLC